MRKFLNKRAQELNAKLEQAYEASASNVPQEGEKDSSLYKEYLAMLKAMRDYYQYCHWVTKGDPYYGDHTMFERLYFQVLGEVDKVGEKFVGLCDESVVFAPEIASMSAKMLFSFKDQDPKNITAFELSEAGLKMEHKFLELSENLYKTSKENGTMTMGLDDMLMSNYNSHESNVYLLSQRTKKVYM